MKHENQVNFLVELAKNESSKKVKLSTVNLILTSHAIKEDEQATIITYLEDNGYLVTPKGFDSMSPLQKKIHRFINDSLLGDLVKNGKATIEVTEEELESLTTESDGKFYVLNKKGDLIKPSCNNTNITEQRRVAEAKKNMEVLNPTN